MKKAISIFTAFTTVLWLSGLFMIFPVIHAADFADGDLAREADEFDVYIIKLVGDKKFKRLILNPDVFNMYGHLNWGDIQVVADGTLADYTTSELVRADGDEKVYKLFPDGDVGTKKWIDSLDCFTTLAYDWDSVYVINTFDRDSYTTASLTMCEEEPDIPGDLTVALAPDNPGAATITINAYGVEYMSVRFTGTGTVNTMVLKRGGAGKTTDFGNIYVYDGARRLVSGKSLSSSTGQVTFNNLGIAVSGTKDIKVVADMSAASAGDVNNFSLTAVSGTVTITGVPLLGSNFAVSAASSGTITVTKSGSIASPNVGAVNAHLSQFKLEISTEAAYIKRVQLLQGGTVKPSDLTNFKLKAKAASDEWDGTINSAGELVFDMGDGFYIKKGGNEIFDVYGDIAGKDGETILLYFELATDVLGIGDQYGFGMATTIASATPMNTSATAHQLTLEGGALTLSLVGPTASNIGKDTDDTKFLRFTMYATTAIEVRKTRLSISIASSSTYKDVTTTNGIADLDDIKFIDEDTGSVIMGPVDGDSFTTDDTDGNPDSSSAFQYRYTDAFEIAAGETLKLAATADVKVANTRTGIDLDDATTGTVDEDQIVFMLPNYADDTPDIAVMKFAGTTTSVADNDISPQADITGPQLSVISASLTLGLSAIPTNQSVVRGSTIDAVGVTFKASEASALVVTDITLTGYSSADGGTAVVGSAGDIGTMVESVSLVESESGTILASSPTTNNLAASAGTLVYTDLSWNIPAGAIKTLLVRVKLLTNAAPTKYYFAFDIVATADVSALDSSSNTVNAAAGVPNAATEPTVDVEYKNNGNIYITEAESSPSKQKNMLHWDQSKVEVSAFKVRTQYEAMYIQKFNVYNDGEGAATRANVRNVYLQYKDENGTWLTTSAQPLSNDTKPSTSFSFIGALRPYIPKDDSEIIKVLIDTNDTAANGATSGATFQMEFSGGAADEFEAVGAGSNVKIDGDDQAAIVNRAATYSVYVYRAYPKFTVVAMSDGPTSGQAVLGKFDITAMGGDILFGTTDAASGSILFDTISSGSGSTAATINLYRDSDSLLLASDAAFAPETNNDSVSFSTFSVALGIEEGQTVRIRVQGDLSSFTTPVNTSTGVGADYCQLFLEAAIASDVDWVDYAKTTADGDAASVVGYLKTVPAYGPYLKGQ